MKIIFINSKGHWVHGWFTSVPALKFGIDALEKAGLEVSQIEVTNLSELEHTLDHLSPDTLVWPNAYFVNTKAGETAWLNDSIEQRGIPFIGSSSLALQRVFRKDSCQAILSEQDLPVPSFLVINRTNCNQFSELVEKQDISPPLILKPTAESGSIGVCKANTLTEAKIFAFNILNEFPNSDVIVEEFLPSDDITCCFLEMGNEVLLLPTYYIVKNVPGATHILGRTERSLAWDGVNKIQPYIQDSDILKQLKTCVPKVVKALGISGITRIDGRLDKEGVLRFFDVNGLPSLSFPNDVTVKQCLTCFPNYPPQKVFEGLIYSIVHQAILKFGMEASNSIQQNHLFNFQSDIVINSLT